MNALALAFNDTQFDVVPRCGQPWLRGLQIGGALGYAKPDHAIWKIYEKNKDEFTESMTTIVDLDTAGGKQKVRIFSLRGCHLLAMFARTKVAKEFRKWVLDRLDEYVENSAKPARQPKALPNGLSADQQTAIKELVKARVSALPKECQAKAAITCWSSLKSKFGCTYKAIDPEQYVEAVSLVARLPLEGEYLPAEPKADGKEPVVINLDADSVKHDVNMCPDLLTLEIIQDGYRGLNPLSRLFMEIDKAIRDDRPVVFKNITGPKAIWMATRELAWNSRHALLDIQRMADGARSRGVLRSQLIKG